MVYVCQKCSKLMWAKEVGSHVGEYCYKCVYGYEFYGVHAGDVDYEDEDEI